MDRRWLHDIDPVAIDLGPVAIHWYGVMYVLGFLAAWWLGHRRVASGQWPEFAGRRLDDLLFVGMLGVLLGGRLGYVIFYAFGDFLRDPLMLLRIQEGGMSFHGGLLGVMVALAWWARRNRVAVFDALDFAAPLVPIGLGLGRIGNFIGGELWGKPTDLPWGVVFPRALGLDPAQARGLWEAGLLDQAARHPSQLYQAFLEGAVLFAVLWWFSSKRRPRHAVSGLFALLYGLFRFAVEFVREPDAHLGYLAFGWLTMGQLLSLPLIGIGALLLLIARRRSARA